MTNHPASGYLRVIDYAASRNDRWLFLATLVVLGVFVWYVLRSFMRQHERLIDDHKKARNAYQNSLRNLVAEQSAGNQKVIACVDNNTKVLQDCRDELRLCREERKQ
jgi:predicted PurR-regulated permease PerM